MVEGLKEEFAPGALSGDVWGRRGGGGGVPLPRFCRVAQSLDARGLVGRFSTFLEHVKPVGAAPPVTRYNALFHWPCRPDGSSTRGARWAAITS